MSTPEAVVIAATMQLKPGTAERAIEAFGKAIAATHELDDGCLLYAIHRDVDDPNRVLYIEHWASEEALAAHMATPHIAELRETLIEVLGAPATMVKAKALPFGDPQKGAL